MTVAAENPDRVQVEPLSLGERLTDRLNPILVKEVRQSLRGRYFRVSFWITLSLATVVGMTVLLVRFANQDDLALMVHGPEFFVAIFACLALATQILVPFSAFLSMGGEWDENTFDLLVLSNLKPWQIVIGKVQSAGVQALLFYSSFGPFLVFAFLLRGVDLLAIFLGLSVSFATSLLLSCLAVAMSSFGQGRFARLVLMVLLAIVLVQSTFVTIAWASGSMMIPGQLYRTEVLQALAAAISVATAVAAFFFAAACARLAHPEENRSTGLRVMTLCSIAVGLCWLTIIDGSRVDDDSVIAAVLASHIALAISSLFFVTEPERLGRRVAVALPKSAIKRALMTPLLPGGARGLLFYLFGSTLVIGWAFVYSIIGAGRLVFHTGQVHALIALPLYGLIFLGIPSAFFSSRLDTAGGRGAARVVTLMLFVASLLLPALIGFLIGNASWADFDHPFNVFTSISEMLKKHGEYSNVKVFLVGGTLVCFMLNMKRLLRAAAELKTQVRATRSDA